MCRIGSPADWGKKSVWILTIYPDRTWDDYMTQFKYKHLTRIDFADDYNKALVKMACPKPPPTSAHGQPGQTVQPKTFFRQASHASDSA